MTYSPSPYQTTSMLQADYKYFNTVRLLADLALSSQRVAQDAPKSFAKSVHSVILEEAEEKVFGVFDGYCLDGYEPDTLAMIQRGELQMTMLEYYTRALRSAMEEIKTELVKRG